MVNETKKNVKVELFPTWRGYELGVVCPHNPEMHMWVKRVYAGEVTWVSDYTHAKHYKSKRSAEAVAKKIEKGMVR